MIQRRRSRSKLAIDGGVPVRDSALTSWPSFDAEEITKAAGVLKSGKVNYWTGTECREFENEFASYHEVDHAVTLANGTLALELALRVLGVGAGDEVIVTPRSFFASASCVIRVGARPVFADVDRDSQNITAHTIQEKISGRTKAILPVHLAGWPCDMRAIMDLANDQGLFVIEDCAQAHGARINGKAVGSYGAAAAFSFCQDKIMSTAGEGGMLLTRDADIWRNAWEFRDHGKSWDRVFSDSHAPGFRWLHESFGSNYRMTEIQGAIGRIQLRKLDQWVSQRRKNAARLFEGLSDISALRIPKPSEDEHHAYYKFYLFVDPAVLKSGWSRDRILESLEAEGIPGWSGSCPEIYREKAFETENHPTLPVAQELGETNIMLPVHPTLSRREIDDMIEAVRKVMTIASQ